MAGRYRRQEGALLCLRMWWRGDSASRVPNSDRLSLQVLGQHKALQQLSLCPQCRAICFLRRKRELPPRFPKRGKGRSSPELGGLWLVTPRGHARGCQRG